MSKVMRQVKLESGNTRLTCWVADVPRLKVGRYMTLKDSPEPDRRWKIVQVSQPMLLEHIHQDWNVGGVDNPRRK